MDAEELNQSFDRLEHLMAILRRSMALMKMSDQDHPARPLVRVMSKLDIIKDWPY
jgi:hypothetical protein